MSTAINTTTASFPWVLLRGLLREQRHWGDFPQQVKRQLRAPKVICLDVAGNGEKSTQTSPDSIVGMVEDLRTDLRRYHIQGPVNVIALSMGAMITTDWLCRYPDEIGQAVLINTSMRPFSPFYQRLKPSTYLSLMMALFNHHPENTEALILRLTSNRKVGTKAYRKLLAHWLDYQKQNPVSGRNALRQLNAARRFYGPNRITHPVLLLASEKDRLVHCGCSQTLARYWHCSWVLHTEAGHDIPLDDPDWVLEQIQVWRTHLG